VVGDDQCWKPCLRSIKLAQASNDPLFSMPAEARNANGSSKKAYDRH